MLVGVKLVKADDFLDKNFLSDDEPRYPLVLVIHSCSWVNVNCALGSETKSGYGIFRNNFCRLLSNS